VACEDLGRLMSDELRARLRFCLGVSNPLTLVRLRREEDRDIFRRAGNVAGDEG